MLTVSAGRLRITDNYIGKYVPEFRLLTGRNARRNNEGRDFSRGPRPVSLPGLRRLCCSSPFPVSFSGTSISHSLFPFPHSFILTVPFAPSPLLSPSSPVRPRNSPFPPARKGTDCPGCRTRLYEAPSPGGLAYTPDNQWLVANGKKGKE